MKITLDEMRACLESDESVRFIEQSVGSRNFVIVSYMISNPELWDKPYGIEARGITFDADTGECVARPFEKFFNLGENKYTQPQDIAALIDFSSQVYVAEKADGSMVTPVRIDDEFIIFKTKKSFYSDTANCANEHAPENVRRLSAGLLDAGWTPIFEFTSPDWKIVLDYGTDHEFTFLTARNIETGEYIDPQYAQFLCEQEGVDMVDTVVYPRAGSGYGDAIMTDLPRYAANYEPEPGERGMEGWVIYTDARRVKIKTQWYCDRHHLIDLRERDFAEMVYDEKADDIMAELIAADAKMDRVEEIQAIIVQTFKETVARIEHYGFTAKEVPIAGGARFNWLTEHVGDLINFAMRYAATGEIDTDRLREYLKKRDLKTWSLRGITNGNFGEKE